MLMTPRRERRALLPAVWGCVGPTSTGLLEDGRELPYTPYWRNAEDWLEGMLTGLYVMYDACGVGRGAHLLCGGVEVNCGQINKN